MIASIPWLQSVLNFFLNRNWEISGQDMNEITRNMNYSSHPWLFYSRDGGASDAKSRVPHRVRKKVALKETQCLSRPKENSRAWRRRLVGDGSVFVWAKRRQTRTSVIVSSASFRLSNPPTTASAKSKRNHTPYQRESWRSGKYFCVHRHFFFPTPPCKTSVYISSWTAV